MRTIRQRAAKLYEWTMMTRYRRHLAREDQKSQAEIKERRHAAGADCQTGCPTSTPRKAFQEHGYALELIEDRPVPKLFPLITRETVMSIPCVHRPAQSPGTSVEGIPPSPPVRRSIHMPVPNCAERAYIHACGAESAVPADASRHQARPEYLSDSQYRNSIPETTLTALPCFSSTGYDRGATEVIAERNIESSILTPLQPSTSHRWFGIIPATESNDLGTASLSSETAPTQRAGREGFSKARVGPLRSSRAPHFGRRL
jgi:hypothetical protein